jgi:cystathionine beta-synthase
VVVLFHDHGSRYVGKIFNDDWMRERGFLEEDRKNVKDLIANHMDEPLVTLGTEELVSHAVAKLRKYNISQIPVVKEGAFVGMIDEKTLINQIIENPDFKDELVGSIMAPPLPVVPAGLSTKELSKLICKDVPAAIVDLGNGKYHIVTRHDLIAAIA